ncbi:MAG: hypothetical protein ABIQ90_05960 [Polaromonas sp.]
MPSPRYRIESSGTLTNSLLHSINFSHLYENSSLAVAIAAKSVTEPFQTEVRVVQIPGGEVIFRTKTID